jgi:hypothetical protein
MSAIKIEIRHGSGENRHQRWLGPWTQAVFILKLSIMAGAVRVQGHGLASLRARARKVSLRSRIAGGNTRPDLRSAANAACL